MIENKILVPESLYNSSNDFRPLIPFKQWDAYGLMNRNGEIVVNAIYDTISEDIYADCLFVKVGKVHPYYYKNGENVSVHWCYLYGIVNYLGKIVLDTIYREIKISSDQHFFTVKDTNLEYSILNVVKDVVIPAGKYAFIDGVERGLARVYKYNERGEKKWGIINMKGEEIVPLKYDEMWNFWGHNLETTRVMESGVEFQIVLPNQFE